VGRRAAFGRPERAAPRQGRELQARACQGALIGGPGTLFRVATRTAVGTRNTPSGPADRDVWAPERDQVNCAPRNRDLGLNYWACAADTATAPTTIKRRARERTLEEFSENLNSACLRACCG